MVKFTGMNPPINWYALTAAKDEQEVGIYPQTAGMTAGYDLHKRNSVQNLPHLASPEFSPDLDCFELQESALLTDIISTNLTNAPGFLVSDRVRTIFDKFQIPGHAWFAASVKHKGVVHQQYNWLHFQQDCTEYIDFADSMFKLYHPRPFSRTDCMELLGKDYAVIRSYQLIHPEHQLYPASIKMKRPFHLDMLFFDFLYHSAYISERIVKALSLQGITGWQVNGNAVSIG